MEETNRSVWVPESLLRRAATQPMTKRLVVAAAGLPRFGRPFAGERPHGAPFAIVTAHAVGGGSIHLAGVTHSTPEGTISVMPAGICHSFHWIGDPWWEQSWLTLVGDDVEGVLQTIGATVDSPVIRVGNLDRVRRLVDEVMRSYEADMSPAGLLQMTGLAWRVLTQLAVDRLRPPPGTPLERAMRQITENPERDVRVADLAAAVGLSTSRLQSLFNAATGGGVIDFLTGVRMARARRLLDDTPASIAAVGQQVGYSDAYYFSRRFRSMHGMSPREYRRRPRP